MKKRFLSLTIALVLCVAMLTLSISAPILAVGPITDEASRTTKEIVYNGQNTGVIHTNIKLPAPVSDSNGNIISPSLYGQNNIDIIEFKLSNKNLTVQAVNNGQYLNSQKTVKGAVADFNSTHEGKTVLAATNADLWMTAVHSHSKVNTGGTFAVPRGMLIIDGEIWSTPQIGNENLEATNAEKGNSTPPKYAFGMTSDYQPLVGTPGANIVIKNTTKNKSVSADGLNRLPANNSLIVYNYRVADSRALSDACEVEVEVDSDVFRHGATISGTVKAVYPTGHGGEATLGRNRIILTARGTRLSTISNFALGDKISISCGIVSSTNQELWQNCVQAVGGHMPILIDGSVSTAFSGSTRWPYTLIGFKDDGTVMMTTIDGRQTGYSVGVQEKQLAAFCKEIGYNSVFWLDGGGSTTMVTIENDTDYVVRNRPSDGSARSVINSVAVCWNDTPRGEQGSLDYIIEPVTFNPLSMDFPKKMAAAFNNPNATSISFQEGNAVRLTASTNSNDPYISFDFSNASKRVDASQYQYIVMRMKTPATVSVGGFQMFLCTGNVMDANPLYTYEFQMTRDGQYHTYILDMTGHKGWNGTLNKLRLDFFDGIVKAGDYVEISQFGFAKTAAEAQMLKESYDAGNTHQWNNGEVTTAPGYGKEGVMTYTCTHCGETKTEAIPALEGKLGDLNNDGEINGIDSGLMLQYLAEWEVEFSIETADVNGDGVVDGVDSGLLLQYLAEWFEEFPAA